MKGHQKKHVMYTTEEKMSFIEKYLHSGLNKSRFARENGLTYDTLRNWLKAFGLTQGTEPKTPDNDMKETDENAAMKAELEEARKEINKLKMELQKTKMFLTANELMIDMAEKTWGMKIKKN